MLPRVDDPAGRTYRFLRETRMAAVVCELFAAMSRRGARVPRRTPTSPAGSVGVRKGSRNRVIRPAGQRLNSRVRRRGSRPEASAGGPLVITR